MLPAAQHASRPQSVASSCAQVRFAEAHGPGGRLSAMAFDANQRRLLTGGSDGVLRFWNANNGSVLREVCSLCAAFAVLQHIDLHLRASSPSIHM